MEIRQIKLAGRDSIARILFEGERWRRVATFSAVLAISALALVVAALEGNFDNPALKIDASHDVGYLNQFILLAPFFVLFVPYYLNGLEPALRGLLANGVITAGEDAYSAFVERANRTYSRVWLTIVPYVVGASVVAFSTIQFWFAHHGTWNSPLGGVNWAVVASAPPVFILYYLIAALVFRIIASCVVIRDFMRFPVSAYALHPDGAGGFAPLGEFSLRIVAASIVTGVATVVGVWSTVYQWSYPWLSAPSLLMMGGYILGLSIAFFLPPWPARVAMRNAKRETLRQIGEQVNREMRNRLAHLGEANPRSQDTVRELIDLYQFAKGMPVFPFNTANIVKFTTSVVWPILLMFIQAAVSKL